MALIDIVAYKIGFWLLKGILKSKTQLKRDEME